MIERVGNYKVNSFPIRTTSISSWSWSIKYYIGILKFVRVVQTSDQSSEVCWAGRPLTSVISSNIFARFHLSDAPIGVLDGILLGRAHSAMRWC